MTGTSERGNRIGRIVSVLVAAAGILTVTLGRRSDDSPTYHPPVLDPAAVDPPMADPPGAELAEVLPHPPESERSPVNLLEMIRKTREDMNEVLDPFGEWSALDPEVFARPGSENARNGGAPVCVVGTDPADGKTPEAPGIADASLWSDEEESTPREGKRESSPRRGPLELMWDPEPRPGSPEAPADRQDGPETGSEESPDEDATARSDSRELLWDRHGEDLRPWLAELLEGNRSRAQETHDGKDRPGVGRAVSLTATTLVLTLLLFALLLGMGIIDVSAVADAVETLRS